MFDPTILGVQLYAALWFFCICCFLGVSVKFPGRERIWIRPEGHAGTPPQIHQGMREHRAAVEGAS